MPFTKEVEPKGHFDPESGAFLGLSCADPALESRSKEVDFHHTLLRFDDIKPDLSRVGEMFMPVSTGADPEILIQDHSGWVVPAWEILPAKSAGTSVYWDGFQAEIGPTPRSCIANLVAELSDSLKKIEASAKVWYPMSKLTVKCSSRFSRTRYIMHKKKLGAAGAKYLQLGCAPSLNAHAKSPEIVPDPMFVTAGFHIHYSTTANIFDYVIPSIVQGMDITVGIMSVALFGTKNFDPFGRRSQYGLAGEYRLPAHGGIEYRTLPSSIFQHRIYVNLFFDVGRVAFRLGCAGFWLHPEYQELAARAQSIINNNDKDAAIGFIEDNRELFKEVFRIAYVCYPGYYGVRHNGLEAFEALLENKHDVAKRINEIDDPLMSRWFGVVDMLYYVKACDVLGV